MKNTVSLCAITGLIGIGGGAYITNDIENKESARREHSREAFYKRELARYTDEIYALKEAAENNPYNKEWTALRNLATKYEYQIDSLKTYCEKKISNLKEQNLNDQNECSEQINDVAAKYKEQFDSLDTDFEKRISNLESQNLNNQKEYSEQIKDIASKYEEQLDSSDSYFKNRISKLEEQNSKDKRVAAEQIDSLIFLNENLNKILDEKKLRIESLEKQPDNRYRMEKEFALLYECISSSGYQNYNSGVTQREFSKYALCCAEAIKTLQRQYTESQLEESDLEKVFNFKCAENNDD